MRAGPYILQEMEKNSLTIQYKVHNQKHIGSYADGFKHSVYACLLAVATCQMQEEQIGKDNNDGQVKKGQPNKYKVHNLQITSNSSIKSELRKQISRIDHTAKVVTTK